MPYQAQRPAADLAERLAEELERLGEHVPPAVLEEVLETLYFASLRTEEGESIRCQVAYMDPGNPDLDPPHRIVKDRWQVTPLGSPIQLTVTSLVDLAKATDPRVSSFAVYDDPESGLRIWGLVDQGNRYYDFVNFDSESGPPPPGMFLASIEAPAQVVARVPFKSIGTLRVDRLLAEATDVVFDAGPVRDALLPGIDSYIDRTRERVGAELFDDRGHWAESLKAEWIEVLCRLLLRARRYGHGGAILITPDDTAAGLNIKYLLEYPRLSTALDSRATAVINRVAAADQIHELMDENANEVPVDVYLNEAVSSAEEDDNWSEIDSSIWFVSLLTRIDGLVLMTPDLGVKGFGVEITTAEAPTSIRRARDPLASSTQPLPYSQYGTRHRSMMRYCWAVPGSVGFVVSQDGDVRVLTRHADDLLVWENPFLQMQLEN